MIPALDVVSLVLAGLLGMAVGGNNLAACCGPLIGSGMVNRRTGILIAITGYLLGLTIEGPKLFRVREIFLPLDTATGTFSILIASLIIFLGGELSKIQLSLSKALTGAILGVSIALGTFSRSGYLILILAFWFLVPLIATALGILLVGLDDRLSPRNLWLKLSLLKTGLLLVSFLSAYVLGSNTLGLIAGVVYNQTLYATLAVGLGAVLGTFVLGRGALRRLTEGIFSLRYPNAFFSQLIGSATVELANQLGVPLSITETVSSGIIGSGLARRMRMMKKIRRLLAVILVLAAVLLTSVTLVNPIFPRVFALQSHSSMLIVGNSGFTSANGVTSGTGTATDPFVISGWNISAVTVSRAHPGTYVHVEIDNTTAYFIIRNISVDGSVNGNGQAAIISGVSNGRVESSNITAYCQAPPGLFCYPGLTVQSSANVTLSGDIINQLSVGGDTNLVLQGSTIGPFGNYAGAGDSLDVNGCQHCLISGNNIVASANFKVSGGSDVTIANNNISADTQGGNWATPLWILGGSGMRITGNTVTGGVGDNVDLDRVSNATVSQNKVRMTAASPYGDGTGIAILSSSNVQVSQNSVVNACCVNSIGILVGVSFNIPPTDIRIFENNVTQAHTGISLQSATNVTTAHNNLFGNTVQATDDKPGRS